MICPYCGKRINKKQAAAAMGRSKSEAKQAASRENGKKGGRPPKKREPSTTLGSERK